MGIFETLLDNATEKGIKQGIEQGIEKGIEQGIEQGIEKGIEQGIEKGIEKGIELKAWKTARSAAPDLFKSGYNVDSIANLLAINSEIIISVLKEEKLIK